MRPKEGAHGAVWHHQDGRMRGGNRPHLQRPTGLGEPGLRREDVVYALEKEGSPTPHQATLYLVRLLLFF